MIALIVASWLSTAGSAGIVVLDVESRVLDKDVARAVQSRVARGVSDGSDVDVEVATTDDLRALADVAATAQALDCDGSSACLVELADAYGAATVVSIRVSKVAGSYALEVVLLDAHTARVLRRVDATSSKPALLDTAKKLGREVVSNDVDRGRDGGGAGLFVGGVVASVVGGAALVVGGVGAVVAQGAVSGRGVSAADKQLGFTTRLPLLGVAAVGAVVTVVGVALAVVGAAE